jgi:hypothetical protein
MLQVMQGLRAFIKHEVHRKSRQQLACASLLRFLKSSGVAISTQRLALYYVLENIDLVTTSNKQLEPSMRAARNWLSGVLCAGRLAVTVGLPSSAPPHVHRTCPSAI